MSTAKTILSLCDYTGAWSQPYRDAGYHVVQVDLKHGQDVRLIEFQNVPVHGILCAPPCTEFAGSGARWWESKGEAALLEGLSIADACLRAVAIYSPEWWVLENPVGRLRRFLGSPSFSFHPADFAENIPGEAYTKKTLLWGRFNAPVKSPAPAVLGSKMHRVPPSPERAALRSVTPAGFARAFFEANP